MTTAATSPPEVKIGEWLKEGWDIFVADVGMFILAGLIYNILNGICLAGLVLFGPLTCGMYLMIFDRMGGGKADIKRLFSGFDYFSSAFLAGFIFFLLTIVGIVVTVLGFSLCVVGSLLGLAILVLIQTAFLFVFQLIIRQNVSATEAIAMSYDKVKENLGQFLLFGLVLWLINYAGYSVMLGCLLTTPLTLAASAAAYRELFEPEGSAEQAQA
jgi:uncharacterized membrane protein